ncbi:MAG TPA: hypothetical protein VJM15_03635 [Sphingomicrobium sp.]|nr:hypothetical protein [Sphingomicrobium sp.]
MRLISFAVCAALGFAPTPATAKDPPEDKIVCKRQYDADTGSHFAAPKKVCLKKSEWKELENATEGSLRKLREQGGACPKCLAPSSGGPG